MALKDIATTYTLVLSPPQKAVMLALSYCRNGNSGRCFPSQKELARMSGFGVATVRRALADIESAGLIKRVKTMKGGYQSNDEYTLFPDPEVVIRVSGAQSEQRSESPEVVIRESLTGDQSEQAVIPTGNRSGREREGARGTRIPKTFTVTPAMAAWARERCPLVDGRTSTERFVNHWMAATRNAVKRDWEAAWRNWLLKDQQDAEKNPTRGQTPEQRMRATLALANTQKEIT